MSPKYTLRDRLKLLDATVTPPLLHASGTWTMTEEIQKNLQTTQRRMMRMIIQTKRITGKGHADAHAASGEDTAGVEPHDPTANRRTAAKTSTSTKKAATTQAATPASMKSQKTIQQTSQNRGSDCVTTATHKADDLSAANGMTSWILRHSQT